MDNLHRNDYFKLLELKNNPDKTTTLYNFEKKLFQKLIKKLKN